jgi:hypothetical protein
MDDKSIIADQLDDLEVLLLPRRKTLLPWWMKFFSYIFLLTAAFAILLYPLMFLLGVNWGFSLYGLESADRTSYIMFTVIALYLLKGAAAYGLLFEKDWAIEVAFADAGAGIIASLFVIAYGYFVSGEYSSPFRLELILLIVYLIKLLKMQKVWRKSPAGTI